MNEGHPKGPEPDSTEHNTSQPSSSTESETEKQVTYGELAATRQRQLRAAASLKDAVLSRTSKPGSGAVVLRGAEGYPVFPGIQTNGNGRFADLVARSIAAEFDELDRTRPQAEEGHRDPS